MVNVIMYYPTSIHNNIIIISKRVNIWKIHGTQCSKILYFMIRSY